MNRSQPYAATIPANGTRFQVLATLAIYDGSGSAQGTPRNAAPRATMNEQRDPPAYWPTGKEAAPNTKGRDLILCASLFA